MAVKQQPEDPRETDRWEAAKQAEKRAEQEARKKREQAAGKDDDAP